MAESRGKRILMMAASATRNEELPQKLQLKYKIPIYLCHKIKFLEVSFQYQLIQLNSTNHCCYFVSEIGKQTVSHQMSGNFL